MCKVTEEILYIPAGVKVNDGTVGKEKRGNRLTPVQSTLAL